MASSEVRRRKDIGNIDVSNDEELKTKNNNNNSTSDPDTSSTISTATTTPANCASNHSSTTITTNPNNHCLPDKILKNIICEEELRKHNNEESCWMAIHGVVYDLSLFQKNHPGGPEILHVYAGGDATESFEEVGHSLSARKIASTYAIGVLKSCKNATGVERPSSTRKIEVRPGLMASFFPFIIALLFLIAAYFLYRS